MTRVLEYAYQGATRLLPPAIAARLDLLRPSYRSSWGGPLNGQEQRQTLVRELARDIAVDVVFETGTYRGTTTEFLSHIFGVHVETVEGSRRFYTYSRIRLAPYPGVNVTFGDSREFLRQVLERYKERTSFIYLDAHWEDDLPLREELCTIRDRATASVVMVDDFAVPSDPGYCYDDYGPGKALVGDYLPAMPGWGLYYPSAPSSEETGKKRGCCVLLSPSLAGRSVRGLRLERVF